MRWNVNFVFISLMGSYPSKCKIDLLRDMIVMI